MKKLIIFSIIVLLFTVYSKAENICGIMYPSHDSTTWGIGFIRIQINNSYGLKGTCSKTQKTCYIVNGEIRSLNEESTKINNLDYVFCGGFSYMLLKVNQIKDTKYLICTRSIEGGIWVDFDELSLDGLKFHTYLTFLNDNKNYPKSSDNSKNIYGYINIGVNIVESCLNLRNYPSVDSTILACLKNNEINRKTITHIELLEIRDGWARITARESVSNYDENNPDGTECSFKIVKEYQGYVKVLNDKGRPNIWYAVSY